MEYLMGFFCMINERKHPSWRRSRDTQRRHQNSKFNDDFNNQITLILTIDCGDATDWESDGGFWRREYISRNWEIIIFSVTLAAQF